MEEPFEARAEDPCQEIGAKSGIRRNSCYVLGRHIELRISDNILGFDFGVEDNRRLEGQIEIQFCWWRIIIEIL